MAVQIIDEEPKGKTSAITRVVVSVASDIEFACG